MGEYDISAAFEEIEAELIRSMARNFRGHRDWELREGFDWPMWQAEQLKAFERYRKEARKAMGRHSAKTDQLIDQLLGTTFRDAAAEQERKILQAIRRGARIPRPPGAGEDPDAFFRTNTRKLDALREATKNDLHTAETATLRMADDVYRKTIFNAQVYANTGAGTLWQAVDMATRSFLAAGLGAVRYRDGRQVNAASYAEMAIRTANKRAYLTGEGAKRQEWGVSLVIVTRRGTGCPYCVKWQGRVYVDDVWSGGRPDGKHPLISTAIAGGLYHPNCKDSHTTFFPGINTEPEPPTAEQRERMIKNYNIQQKQRYYERQVRKYKRLEAGSLDPANKERYAARRQEWQARTRELVAQNPDVLRREYAREKVRVPVAVSRQSDIIKAQSGGRIKDPESAAATAHAERYYGLVRSMKTDVAAIAKNTGIPEPVIQRIKGFIFLETHDLGGPEPQRFDPDFAMAQSWQRLIAGKTKPHDLTLLNHEILEKKLMDEGMTQYDAHIAASQKYNYGKEVSEYYASLKKHQDRG